MPALARASIVVIGDEILDGHTRDTNSGWLAERLSARGVPVDRVVTVPDTMEAIDEA
ncbi:MAG: molybdopterin-binding protein, partial [Actinomycetota bacterium]